MELAQRGVVARNRVAATDAGGLRGERGGHAFRVIPIAYGGRYELGPKPSELRSDAQGRALCHVRQQLRQMMVYVAEIVGGQRFEGHGGASADHAFVR